MEWQPIETAPRDGTAIQARIPGHGKDFVIGWHYGLVGDFGEDCASWIIVEDQEPPDDWCDGVCWATNSEGKPSTQPTHWMSLPEPPK